MKRNFNVPVIDFEGRSHVRPIMKYDDKGMPVVKDGIHEFSHHEPMLLRHYALDTLAGRWQGEEKLDGAPRMKLYHKICFAKDGIVEIEGTDIATIVTALTNQGRSFLVIDAMQQMLNTDYTEMPAHA
jgi:hypothetical protein